MHAANAATIKYTRYAMRLDECVCKVCVYGAGYLFRERLEVGNGANTVEGSNDDDDEDDDDWCAIKHTQTGRP